MDEILARRRRFGCYLEMSGNGGVKRAKLLRLDESEKQRLRGEFGSRLVSRSCTPTLLVSALGSGTQVEENVFEYDLMVRSGYLFRFTFAFQGAFLVSSGYVPLAMRRMEFARPTNPGDAKALGARLVRDGVCAEELRIALGEPDSIVGWWPSETWSYGEHLTVELRLGVCDDGASVPVFREGLSHSQG